MSSKSSDQEAGVGRRSLLKIAGAAALGATGVGAARAAKAASARAADGDIFDVAIIGAGLSGLTAARDLLRAGCDSVVVLEARGRVGGRTLNFDVGRGYVSEVGGQWIGPGQTAVADLARELQVETFPQYVDGNSVVLGGDGRFEIDLHGTFGTDEAISAKLSDLSRYVPSGAPWTSPKVRELDALSVGDWLKTQPVKPEDQNGWGVGIGLTGGVTPAKMGLLHYLSMINSAGCDFGKLDSIKDGAQGTRFVGGSQILSIKLADQLGPQIVRLSFPIRSISGWNTNVVTLQSEKGVVRARRVIMALSPTLCNQIRFDPVLPEGRSRLQKAWPSHSPARKTAMVYSRPFWRQRGLNGHIYQYDGPVIWAWDNSPPDSQLGIINAFVFNAELPSDPHQAQKVQTAIYAQAFGDEALAPIAYHDRDWGFADPWTITCVSAIPPGFWSQHGPALKPPCGQLIWAGTETADIWAGYMDGAVRSGHRSALQALNSLRET